jgi:uncharacterized glyoxalase superfamily protein PhnB
MSAYSTSEPPRVYATFRFNDAARMIDWLVEAFGFAVHARYDDEDGKVMHAELAFGSSMIMCGQARDDEFGTMVGASDPQGGKSLYIAVDNVDALHEQAKNAGATITQSLTDRDYGSREFICRDPEGNVWCFGTYWPKASEKV